MPKNKGKGGKNRRRGESHGESAVGSGACRCRVLGRAAWERARHAHTRPNRAAAARGAGRFFSPCSLAKARARLTHTHTHTHARLTHTRARTHTLHTSGKTESDEKRELIFKEDGQGERS